MNLSEAVFTEHARLRMTRRGIDEGEIRTVLTRPEVVLPVRTCRVVAQAVVGEYLLRVFLDVDRDPPEIVTAYKTSKIGKYRRQA